MKQKVVILVGMSGSGKTTILNSLLKRNPDVFEKVVEYTNRPMRDSEVEGKDYHFVDDSFFENNEFLAKNTYHTVFGDWHYGITEQQLLDSTDKTQILVTGAKPSILMKELLNTFCDVHIIFLNPSFKTIKERLKERGDDETEVNRRILADASDFQYMHRHCDLEVATYFYESTIDLVERYLRKVEVL